MKKQGFTLIELMVVVVIIGILAAVAVPKLFGMIAKSKASEVGPAAGTYVKLQQAYVNEANKYGPWNLIGYTAPGTAAADGKSSSTTNFTYSGAEVNESGVTAAVSGAWVANNIATLNDCAPAASSGNWTVSTNEIGSDGQDSYTAAVGSTDCKALTPTFDKIGQ